MKILLVKPFVVTDEVQAPIGLGYLATALRKKHDVEILDCIRDKIKINEFRNVIKKKKYDVIGFQCYALDVNIVKSMIKIVKSLDKNTIVVVGGPQPSSDPKNILDYLNADFGFKGEAEIGFPNLLDCITKKKKKDLKNIPGLIWGNKKNIVINDVYFVEDLDKLGIPSWDLLKINKYPSNPHGAFFKNYPIAPITTSRGCPFNCTFCGGFLVSGRRFRSRSVQNVIEEIELLHKKYGINEIHIEDDNFTLKRDFVIEFCKEIIRRKLNISLNCPNGVRLDTLDEEVLFWMKKSGFYSLGVGIESGSDRILKLMKKNLTTKQIIEKVRLIRKFGLDVVGFFIVGFPGETKEDIKKTIRFACKLDLKRANFMSYKPLIGTESYEALLKDGEIKDFKELNLDDFSLAKVVYAPKGMSKKELKNLRRNAFLRFYLRPKIFFRMLKEIKSFQHFKFVVARIIRWLK